MVSDLPIQCLRRRVLGEAQHVASPKAGQAPRLGDEKKPQGASWQLTSRSRCNALVRNLHWLFGRQ
jgi:hypothetical protein